MQMRVRGELDVLRSWSFNNEDIEQLKKMHSMLQELIGKVMPVNGQLPLRSAKRKLQLKRKQGRRIVYQNVVGELNWTRKRDLQKSNALYTASTDQHWFYITVLCSYLECSQHKFLTFTGIKTLDFIPCMSYPPSIRLSCNNVSLFGLQIPRHWTKILQMLKWNTLMESQVMKVITSIISAQ